MSTTTIAKYKQISHVIIAINTFIPTRTVGTDIRESKFEDVFTSTRQSVRVVATRGCPMYVARSEN
jgi:hypothetical protein